MHEMMSPRRGVLQLVEATARRENARRVKTVVLEIGRLSSVEPGPWLFLLRGGDPRQPGPGAALEIVAVPGQGWYPPCGATVAMAAPGACPAAAATGYNHRGTEMRVKEIEIE